MPERSNSIYNHTYNGIGVVYLCLHLWVSRVIREFREFASESEKPQVDAWLKSIDEYFQESYSKGSANL